MYMEPCTAVDAEVWRLNYLVLLYNAMRPYANLLLDRSSALPEELRSRLAPFFTGEMEVL